MGCDIHAVVERKGRYGWLCAGDPDIGRDYELFAVLAGVRNSYDLKPISEPKGLPENVSRIFSAYAEHWNSDGHSASWVDLVEMKGYDLSQEIDDQHLILSRDESGKITSTCGGTTGEHLGPVGKRTIFGLWGREFWDGLIAFMEKQKHEDQTDEQIRLVFFFDN